MSHIPTPQIIQSLQTLEDAGATVIGKILFEFTRLDANLGTCLVNIESVQRVDEETNIVSKLDFDGRIKRLSKETNKKLQQNLVGLEFINNWILRANTARLKRNNLFHGRWGFALHDGTLVNVIGLPTSIEQSSTKYTLDELQDFLNFLKQLQIDLAKIAKQWQL